MTGDAGLPDQAPVLTQSVRSVPDHEVLLSFDSDEAALLFATWLQDDGGWTAFLDYAAP